VPVVDEDGHLVGIITNRDLRFETRFDIPVSEVMDAAAAGDGTGGHHSGAG